MNVREYRLYGASELAAVTRMVAEASSHWREEWFAARVPIGEPVICREPFRNGGESPRWLTGKATSGGSLSIGYPSRFATSLAELVAGRAFDARPVAGQASPLELGLQAEMLRALGEEIVKRARLSSSGALEWFDGEIAPEAAREHSGFVTLRVGLATAGSIDIVLSSEIAAGVVSGAAVSARHAALEPRASALDNQALRVTVRLHDAELRLDELRSLSVGHVISLPHGLDMPARVVLGDDEQLCAGHLGTRHGKKAIQLIPT